ncbi:DUF2294 domain-containing protein [Paenibacillus sp. OV219]|uniref:DUF2294 domain-containing protein n=1 Tax=Paenibacillus sp. OV219 TaxID=1884377 RepID=UPI0008B67F5F|nr:Na-translocating system protein MpsC family protein [Paenibacillus sp. OV219]SEO02661.1 Uncharacterized protein YbcI [Paenibacillus sp. OV219]
METNDKQIQAELTSHIGRLLRDAFGKGPQSIFVSINRPFVIIYLRNFLSPTEKILLKQDQVYAIQTTRDLLMKSLFPEMKAYILLLTGMNIQEFYYDWGLHNQSGVMVGIDSEEDHPFSTNVHGTYAGQEELHQEIDLISHNVEKKPEKTYSYKINERTILVMRIGILISIEKELIRIGQEETLKLAKRNLEKGHLHRNNRFQKILHAGVVDAFVDWDFHLDKSIIVLILHPSP